MVPNLSVISSNSTGLSTRATQLYRPEEIKLLGSPPWSAKVAEPLLNSISPIRRSGTKLADAQSHLAPPEQGSPRSNEGNKTGSSRRRQRKSVTFEDNVQESNAEDIASTAGTVRRRSLPSRGSVQPAFYAQPFQNGHSGNHQQDTEEWEDQSEKHPLDTENTTYEHWRELRRRLERNSESEQPPKPDGHLLRPKIRTHSRTVSHEDVLTGRGANPRTGVVSPSIVSESGQPGDSRGDLGQLPGGHRWRLKGDQWISIDTREETPTPKPPTMKNPPQHPDTSSYWQPQPLPNGHISQGSKAPVPLSELEDRFVVNMPSAREPCPPTMTPQQIEDFQKSISRAHELCPNSPPSPANEARGDQLKKPEKKFSIARKAVGSSPSVSRRTQPNGGYGPSINAIEQSIPDINQPNTSPTAVPRQKQYYNPDEVGKDLVGSTYNRQVSNNGERSGNVSQHPFLDVSGGQGNEREKSKRTPLSPKINSSLPPFLTSETNTEPIITGEQESVTAGTQHGGQELQRVQNSQSSKRCRCRSHTIPGKGSQKPRWLRHYLPSQRKGERQSTRTEENQGMVASTNTSTSTTTSTTITTSSPQDHTTEQTQTVDPSGFIEADGIACAHHTITDLEESHPQNEILDTQAPAWDLDAVNCNVLSPKNVPSHTHVVATPVQQIRSHSPSSMPGSTPMQENPNDEGKTNTPAGERCSKCHGYYYVRDNNQQVSSGLKKSYTLVEQSRVRTIAPSRNGKLYRRNTDGTRVELVEAKRPCCGTKVVIEKPEPKPEPEPEPEPEPAPANETPENSKEKKEEDKSSDDISFLDRLFSLLSESYTLIHQHHAFQHAKTLVNRLFSMAAHCFDVAVRIYDSCCVYSQTGSWPQFQDQELNRLMRDLGRAGIYLVVLATVATLLGRAWTYLVMVGSWFLWVLMPVRWAVWKVFRMMFASD